MTIYTSISEAAAAQHRLAGALANHIAAAKAEEQRLRAELSAAQQAIAVSATGFDLGQIAVAESVLFMRGSYANAGEDRASVVRDAIAEIATGEKAGYHSLWTSALGTKDYARWHGQRSDHEYGYGPEHGSVIFQIGLRKEVLKRDPQTLTATERNACVYYLTNLERIQAERVRAVVAA